MILKNDKITESIQFKEIIQLYILFFLSIIIIYKTSPIIALFFQLFILILFYFSKRDYFWFAFVFLIQASPGALFNINDIAHTFSLLRETPLGVLFFWLLFILIAFVKSIGKKGKNPFFLKFQIIAMIIYIFVLLIAFRFDRLNFFGSLLSWLFLIIIPKFFKSETDYESLFSLIFSFVFFVTITQIIFMLTGNWLDVYFGGRALASSLVGHSIDEVNSALRPMEGIQISFFALIGSVYYLVYKKSRINKNYLYLVAGFSTFNIFLTATRGWIIAAIIIVSVLFLHSVKNPLSLIPKIILSLVVFTLLFIFVPTLNKQSTLVLERLSTLVTFAEGDVTAGGTLSRLDERSPRVMKKFYESPVLGYGWSKTTRDFRDPHVGNQSLLLSAGIIGYFLYIILWGSFLFKVLWREKQLFDKNPYKNTGLVLAASLIAIIIIHSTSSQWFSYGMGYNNGFIVFLLMCFANHYYWESARLNKNQYL